MNKAAIPILLAAMAIHTHAQDSTKTFYANDDKKRDVVTFTSKAPMETVVGTTGDIVGFVEVNPLDVTNSRARFEVELASLKTGIGMRDGHMRNQYLETDKYPKAVFELTRVISASSKALEDQKTIDLMAEGNFSLHGVTKKITIPLKITFYNESDKTKIKLPGDMLRIEATWPVLLSDYKINRPQFIVLKLDDKQVVNIDVFASTGSPPVNFAQATSKQ